MALILAVNPGNRHSPTLARLARELRGCELMGAESCPVAIKAIKKRVPDVLLLPAVPAKGEADLMAHLKSIPGGVLTRRCHLSNRPTRSISRQANSRAVDGGAHLHAVDTSFCRSTATPQCTNTQANPGAAVTNGRDIAATARRGGGDRHLDSRPPGAMVRCGCKCS